MLRNICSGVSLTDYHIIKKSKTENLIKRIPQQQFTATQSFNEQLLPRPVVLTKVFPPKCNSKQKVVKRSDEGDNLLIEHVWLFEVFERENFRRKNGGESGKARRDSERRWREKEVRRLEAGGLVAVSAVLYSFKHFGTLRDCRAIHQRETDHHRFL